jgi:hypothetical protein
MAFERDPECKINVTNLDYNSLQKYEGPLQFSEGMRYVSFYGKKKGSNLIKNASCLGNFERKFFNFDVNTKQDF